MALNMKTISLRKIIFYPLFLTGFVFILFCIFNQSVIFFENNQNNTLFQQLRNNTYPAKCTVNCITFFLPPNVKTCGIHDSQISTIIIAPAYHNIVFYSASNNAGKNNIVDFTLANNNPDSLLKSDWYLSTQPIIIDMYNKTLVSSDIFLSHANKKDLVHDLNYIISSFCSDLQNNY